jgi:hypothetical protein
MQERQVRPIRRGAGPIRPRGDLAGVIQGTFSVIQATFGVIQGMLRVIQ